MEKSEGVKNFGNYSRTPIKERELSQMNQSKDQSINSTRNNDNQLQQFFAF